ncbi:Sulfur carrier protein ThiS adenylyltransferase [Pseudobythopirellula maris]|uniref:Sulfur carrier protein ThiS adenylyltransferase n=1 Tax=Pseudobythopirellula maris TaxID=2527991 RepID=A0A5C5ZJ54_9BACT|nr:ThiF family adenylyltransferase [Pseudobythopirellula maris]TWT87155.1 Sulfur carrier protein ThiS adenylyltransferase [Pseudobythopirellula maris]
MSETIHLDEELRGDGGDGRFARFELIGWWDQKKLAGARALVIGAGALGNEIVKNLALLGVGQVLIVDLDQIEMSNLSRSVLFRADDCGREKAAVAAERARDLYPGMGAQSLRANAVYDLGLGVYRWADVILGGLDNREARVAINQAAAKVGKPWIDGAIERLDGVARVFDPASGPCYECTMSEVDWKMLEARRSCALLSRDEIAEGKTPTTPTTSSVVAGVQVQEAVKLLHGLPALSGQGFVFDGVSHQSYVVSYSQLEGCPSHEAIEEVVEIQESVAELTAGALLDRARQELGPTAVLEFNHELLESLSCGPCGATTPKLSSLGAVKESDALCPECGEMRAPNLYHSIADGSPLLEHSLAELGVPAWDVVVARAGLRRRGYELSGDRPHVLGPLVDLPANENLQERS